MSWLSKWAHSTSASLVRNRSKLPRWLNRLIDDVAKNPDGLAGRLASTVLGGGSASQVPAPTLAPETDIRVYIGPTNYSGQGRLWAQALSASSKRIGARNMAVELPGGFAFPADTSVPVAVYNRSESWQRSELSAVEGYTHVLIEAERPLFGSLFGRDVGREVSELQRRGLSVAFLSHGTDIRSPRKHRELTEWSPFADDDEQTALLQTDAENNLALLRACDRPVFVSTPDLLLDLPEAQWCPVVIDDDLWSGGRELASSGRLVVAHIPSMGSMKGTHLIDEPVRALERAGLIEYRQLSGIPAAEMPAVVHSADIVLDQFRLGSYGVAACEAMAAGRVVIGHILDSVRAEIRTRTGFDLPIVEATPATIASVIDELCADLPRVNRLGAEGVRFVHAVHSGKWSARILRQEWINLRP